MIDRDELTAADRAALATIDAVLDDRDMPATATDPLAEFSRVLRDSAPEAADAFRQRLRAEVVEAATAAQADRTGPWWRRRLTRRQIVAAGIVGVGLGGAAVAVAQFARLVNAGLSADDGETLEGWAFDQTATAPLTIQGNTPRLVGMRDTPYVYSFFQVSRVRWGTILQRLDPKPTPGTTLLLGSNGTLPIPAYLPVGFEWQGTSAIYAPGIGPGPIGSTSGGGGSGNLPWERSPSFDVRSATYLIGGDPADRFIVLARLPLAGHPGLRVGSWLFDVADRPVPFAAAPQRQQGGPDPTPTPPPSAYTARVAALVLARPANSGAATTIGSGADVSQETTVSGLPARSFNGVWAPDGSWNGTEDWGNLVWERDGYLYHIAAQQLALAELIRVAESLPAAP